LFLTYKPTLNERLHLLLSFVSLPQKEISPKLYLAFFLLFLIFLFFYYYYFIVVIVIYRHLRHHFVS